MTLPSNLLLTYTAYFVGAASPGPSILAIMSVATHSGRRPALVFSCGILSGAMFWATMATLGLSTVLMTWSDLLVAIKLFGGAYLLWLAFKSGRSACSKTQGLAPLTGTSQSFRQLYLRGLLMHLTNPKAILVWISIVSLAASNGVGASILGPVVPGCAMIGAAVFGGYALLFSMPAARALYARIRRGFDGSLALVFGYAGIKMLLSRGASAARVL